MAVELEWGDDPMSYVLIVASYGDGEVGYGLRFTSLRFTTRKAADEAAAWLSKMDGVSSCRIIHDTDTD